MFGIIGGSGFYSFIDEMNQETIETPFGQVIIETGMIEDKEVIFIPRHGKKHSIPPHLINYRANIYAAHVKKVDRLLATNAVGALHHNYSLGDLVLISDIIDFSKDRESTFFDGTGFEVQTNLGSKLSGVVHTDVTQCYNQELRKQIIRICEEIPAKLHPEGVVVVSNGPRFESPAEIQGYREVGGDLIGMTSAPEVFLAKELDIPYASVAIVTNYAAGLQSSVSAEEVFQLFSEKIEDIKNLIWNIIVRL